MNKTYLGDGVYVEYKDFHLILTTEDGLSTINKIYLDENVLQSLLIYLSKFIDIKI